MSKKLKTNLIGISKWLFLIIMAVFAIMPLLQVFLNSLREDSAIKAMPIGLPEQFSLQNYIDTWTVGEYGIAYFNTILVAAGVICVVLIVVGLGAYALTKLEFKLRGFMSGYFFVAMSLPGFLCLVPDYILLSRLGLVNTRVGLALMYIVGNIPFNMLLIKTFLLGIPREVEEAAKVDGCTELNTFLKITLPIAKPIFMTVAMLIFVNVWNEYLMANTFMTSDSLKTVATRFVRFSGQFGSNMARIYTASAITIAPIIVMYLLFSRRFIEGMTSGSVKG